MNYAFRLTKGKDLRKEIEKYFKDNKIESGVIKSAVGCVSEVYIRLAGGKDYYHKVGEHEIVSVTGTLSRNDCHIHISFADNNGNVVGGHLKEGCIVSSTAEICLESFKEYTFDRILDENTGYEELVIINKGKLRI